ncbi:Nn.00g031050.m01.CDS01 [Neocucurbitaria sp. VM-36]
MSPNLKSTNSTDENTSPNPPPTTFFHTSTELADLGRERFDHDTAAIGDRDFALYAQQPVAVKTGRAPKGMENQVFAWNTFQFTTEERDDREELKGNLHEGQLHRQNRAAREGEGGMMGGGGGRGGARGRGERGSRGGRVGGGGEQRGGLMDALCAGKKRESDAPPLAKGFAEELDKSMFWDGPIV